MTNRVEVSKILGASKGLRFRAALAALLEERPALSVYVQLREAAFYQTCHCFVSHSGRSLVAVTSDSEIISLFSLEHAGRHMLEHVIFGTIGTWCTTHYNNPAKSHVINLGMEVLDSFSGLEPSPEAPFGELTVLAFPGCVAAQRKVMELRDLTRLARRAEHDAKRASVSVAN